MSANALRDTLRRRIVDVGGSTECQEVSDVMNTRVWSCSYSDVDGAAGVYEISMIVPAERALIIFALLGSRISDSHS
jgi:hypothetical protein